MEAVGLGSGGVVRPVSEGDLENFHKKLRRSRASEPVPLRFRLTEQERARLAVRKLIATRSCSTSSTRMQDCYA